MIAPALQRAGDTAETRHETLERLLRLDEERFARRQQQGPQSTYLAGETDRLNPVPRGVDPYGTDADYHYRTERNYFLMVERGRAAVRNHPLVEQGINRLLANMKLGTMTADIESGDESFDADHKAWWQGWCGETEAGRNLCDYEGTRSFGEIAQQSFFSRVQDGDVLHLPLVDGRLQTWEAHHLRNPWGHRPTGLSTDGIVHGVEIRGGHTIAYHLTPMVIGPGQTVTRRSQTRRFAALDAAGNKIAFWLGFRHRFNQRRGISRLSPPRDAMTGFDDLNYAHVKSALRRSLISYLMQSATPPLPQVPGVTGSGRLPQSGDRYAEAGGLGLRTAIVEQQGEPAQVIRPPEGWKLEGWNANLPSAQFFEHSALLLTMLAVNLDLPLMFLLLDGSLVNFHGGRMTFDQAKLRFRQLQRYEIQNLWSPVYEWKTRQRITPGSPHFDRAAYAAVRRGANPFRCTFRPAAWPYVKPLEDAAAEDLAERRNLRSLRSILADRGIDHDEHVPEIIHDRGQWAREAIREAIAIRDEFPEAEINVAQFFRELWYGTNSAGVQLSLSADGGGELQPAGRAQEAR